jgi:hypothetical protein
MYALISWKWDYMPMSLSGLAVLDLQFTNIVSFVELVVEILKQILYAKHSNVTPRNKLSPPWRAVMHLADMVRLEFQ